MPRPVKKKPSKSKSTLNKRPAKVATKTVKPKPDSKVLKVFSDESVERFKEVGEMVLKKELRWWYYKEEDNRGCHFYRILKKKLS